jgi:glutathionylspermidine synthase
VRWSSDFLTDNDTTWMCPIGARNNAFEFLRYDLPDRKKLWDEVVERAMFEHEFTGQYININEFISLNSLILNDSLFQNINDIAFNYCRILNKTAKLVRSNFDMFYSLLGIPENLKSLVLNSCTDSFCAVGRIDMVIDNNGVIKILEFNSETPAGLVESIGIQKIIKERLYADYINPNENLRSNIKESFEKILTDFTQNKSIKNIAFLCTSYHEDWYNTGILRDICKDIHGYNIFFGNIYDLEARGEKLYLYGIPLDAIYRYFPLDWIAYDDELNTDVLSALNSAAYSINPTHTLITQSKSIYAVIYELTGKGFYTGEEELFIRTHLPYTCLEPNSTLSPDSLSKPFLSREGKGIVMSYEGFDEHAENMVYQDRANIMPVEMIKYTTLGSEEEFQFPVIGVYIAGDKPSGIFTRAGDFITNESASFVPTLIKK